MASFLYEDQSTTHHCEIIEGNEHSSTSRSFRDCTVNPGHTKFIPVADFREEHLPKGWQESRVVKDVRNHIDRTVRVALFYTSYDRPDTYQHSDEPYPCSHIKGNIRKRCGTGYVARLIDNYCINKSLFRSCTGLDPSDECPCISCNPDDSEHLLAKARGRSNQRPDKSRAKINGPVPMRLQLRCSCKCLNAGRHSLYLPDPTQTQARTDDSDPREEKECYYFLVYTAAHVIYDKWEARRAVFELFYDSEDREGIECLYGVGVLDPEVKRSTTDNCYVLCVTHSFDLAKHLGRLVSWKNMSSYMTHSSLGILISHPHGASKMISIGNVKTSVITGRPGAPPIKLMKGMKVRFCVRLNQTGDPTDPIDQQSYHVILNKAPTFDASTGYSDILHLQHDVIVVLPPDLPIKRSLSIGEHPWYKVPSGTELVTDNSMSYVVPKMEFLVDDQYTNLYTESFSYITYDMASCPGSSGALVIHDPRLSLMMETIHHGSGKEDGNESGLRPPDRPSDYILKEYMFDRFVH